MNRLLNLPVNGDMGQDVHLAKATKPLRLMLGFDDDSPENLHTFA
jgi:hypothetical protein